ncbi:MAG: glycosyltransferase involved in cell wall biosynthesis [Natronomonas sp.]|jgi:glycosyltransferase involved in cell wall biosynthesis|uniref:glycosyltransferase n=1 Tax=Natronomonas sp. TaxID=2184060 RepID=UPI003989F1DB
MTRLGVVIPALQPSVPRLEAYLRDIVDELDPHVVRIELDDPDATASEAVSSIDVPTVEVNSVPYRRGKGAAITEGFEAIDTDRLAFADADGSTPASELARVVDALEGADVAAGSRRHPDAHVVGHQTFARRFLGDGFAWFARRLLDAELYDYQCGAKALTAEAWERVRTHLYEPGFAWDVELLAMAAALGLDIVEVPIKWEDMPGSTVDPVSTTFSLGAALFTTRHRAKRLQNSRFHGAIAATREETPPLVDREQVHRGGRQ